MGAGASANAEAETEVVRPARYVAARDRKGGAANHSDHGDRGDHSDHGDHEDNDDRDQVRAKSKKSLTKTNRLRQTRIEKMMSKAELARRANLSVLTIDRVEKGLGCRMDTKRKILEALGLSLADRVRVFGEEE